MTLRYKICLFAVKLFKDHGINVDRAEFFSLSIFFGVGYFSNYFFFRVCQFGRLFCWVCHF